MFKYVDSNQSSHWPIDSKVLPGPHRVKSSQYETGSWNSTYVWLWLQRVSIETSSSSWVDFGKVSKQFFWN